MPRNVCYCLSSMLSQVKIPTSFLHHIGNSYWGRNWNFLTLTPCYILATVKIEKFHSEASGTVVGLAWIQMHNAQWLQKICFRNACGICLWMCYVSMQPQSVINHSPSFPVQNILISYIYQLCLEEHKHYNRVRWFCCMHNFICTFFSHNCTRQISQHYLEMLLCPFK